MIEVPLYGSSRLGVWRPDREVETTGWELFDTDPMTGTGGGIAGGWERGRVQFELSNHLGNVLVTISDVRIPVLVPEGIELCDDPVHPACYRPIDYYLPQVLTANDYYPFGMGMPGRKYSEGEYRYGFNGKEKDIDINSLTAYDYGFRIYNPAIGRFLSVDPLMQSYPWYTPYQFAGNNPIWAIDVDGLEEEKVNENSGESNPNEVFRNGQPTMNVEAVVVSKKKKPGFFARALKWTGNALGNAWEFTKKEILPRAGGVLKTVAGGAIMVIGAGTSEFGVGIPVFAFGADYGGSGLKQIWYGSPQKTLTQQVLEDHGMDPGNASLLVDGSAIVLSAGTIPQRSGPPMLGPNTLSVEMNVVRSIRAGMNVSQTKNIAYMEGRVGGTAYHEIGISGENAVVGAVSVPERRFFETVATGANSRMFDAEVKLLENFAARYHGTPNISGTIKLVSERAYCTSCTGVIEQFQKMFPNIKIVRVDGIN